MTGQAEIVSGSTGVPCAVSGGGLGRGRAPGADHCGTVQLGCHLPRVEQVCGRAGTGRVARLAAGRVGENADNQVDAVAEPLMQLLRDGGGPGRQAA
jgi:hypothetical protein